MSRRAWRRVPIALVACTALAGCGDGVLWSRYRAERDMWRAERAVERISIRPALAPSAQVTRASRAFDSIVARYPARRWAAPAVRGPGAERDIAVISGRALLARGRIDEMLGRLPRALDAYDRAAQDFAGLSPVERAAFEARAEALEHAGQSEAALDAWERIVIELPVLDDDPHWVPRATLAAPLRAAALLASLGREAGADSLLDAASERFARVLADTSLPASTRARLDVARAEQRQARGDRDGSLAGLRASLQGGLSREEEAGIVLSLGEQSLAAGRPDSARAYASWAARGFGGLGRREGMQLIARSWQQEGQADSTLAAWGRLLDAYPRAQDAAAEARFQRGVVLEGLGRWEQARSEFRALAAGQPAHRRALEAQLRIVQHHARLGETELARLEGRHVLELMSQLIATQHDDAVQSMARRCRADVYLALDEPAQAADALSELWRRYPASAAGARAGLDAARLAEQRLGAPARAESLYVALAQRAVDPEVQSAAAAAVLRMRGNGQ